MSKRVRRSGLQGGLLLAAGVVAAVIGGLTSIWLLLGTGIGIAAAGVGMLAFGMVGDYELKLGWRYLYGGKKDRMLLAMAGGAALVSLGGLGILLGWSGNPAGVIMFVLGLIATAVFLLLSLFTVFTSVSILGVALGVAALTIVLAVTTGFQKQFRDKVLGVNAHVIVLKSQATFAEYRDVMKTSQEIDPDVLAVQPFIFAEMLVTRGKGRLSGVAIKGIDPSLVNGVLDLEQHMLPCDQNEAARIPSCGSVESLANAAQRPVGVLPPIIMGKELAYKLKARIGDDVTVVVPLSNIDFETWRAKSSAPRTRRFRVSGIFYSGFDEYDRRLMYTSLLDTQDLVGRGDQVMGVELKVKDVDRANEIAEKLEKELGGPPYQVQDWYELNHNLFTALNLQKLALVIILTLIILVAAVNMVSALIMMVTDKTREIAILKSMGASSASVAWTFQIVGVVIGSIGMVIGVALGLATCYVVSQYGYHLDPKVYLIDKLPIEVRWFEVVLVAGITMVVSVLVTLFPALQASAQRPAEGLRYD